MRTIDFIIGVRVAQLAFEEELRFAWKDGSGEYFRLLKCMGFYSFMDYVMTACVMYPCSINHSEEEVRSLSYMMFRSHQLERYYLTPPEQNRLTELVIKAGMSIIEELDSHGYYVTISERATDWSHHGMHETDVTAISNIRQIGKYSFEVQVKEMHIDDDLPPLPNKSDDFYASRKWSH